MSYPYWQVDAFAERPFAGNQAGVLLLDGAGWPDDETMLAAAAENMFAETAFLLPDASGAADFELRWFTPAMEVALCGHATLASGHALLAADKDREQVTFRTRKSGILQVRRAGVGYELALPAIKVGDPVAGEMLAGLGALPSESAGNKQGYVIALYANEVAVRALVPDMAALAAHGDVMFIATAPGDAHDIVSRVFVPGAGVPEDSVTGSAHAALTPYWSARLGRTSFTAHQASRRGGDLVCRLEGERVWLGGRCVTVAEGRYFLTG